VCQTAFTAAICGQSVTASCRSFGILRAAQKSGAPFDDGAIRRLTSHIAGRVITPEAAEYDRARGVFNLAYDRHPLVIVRCAGPSDVSRTVEFAQIHNLPLAIRAGGHSRLGYGMCDGGVVVDLSALKKVDVDAGRREVRVEAGALVVELDTATQRFGLATTSGGCPTVGVAGFALGGGEGRLMEKYGTACDNLLSAQVVTVDGREIEASPEVNPDMFWAIRGGGGNFGIVTSFKFKLHPVDQVLSGALTYSAGRIPELLDTLVKFLAMAPDEMDAFAQLLPSEDGRKLRIDICFCGDAAVGDELLRPLRALKPQNDTAHVMSYLNAQAAGGFLVTPVAHFQTNLYLRNLGERAIAAITAAITDAPVTCKVIIVPLRGAVSRVRVTDTAFALREPGYELDIAGTWSTPALKADVLQWVNTTRDRLQPFAHGVYVNQLGDTSDDLVRTAYGSNYPRLAAIKKKYDPRNVLRLNQNIKPEGLSRT
jgi:hypothetical protein